MILLDSGGHSGLVQKIIEGDRWLFSKINQDWSGVIPDNIFPYLREAEFWVPFYLFLLVFITLNFGKKGLWWAFSLIMTAVVSDLISSHLIKAFIFRTRPCQDPNLAENMRVLVIYCPMSSSFTSSHACNHFALASFIWLTLRQLSPWWAAVFIWAAAIAYAQVYVGVHFPIDVLSGAILGCGIGWAMSRVFRLLFGTLNLQSYNHQHA